MKPILILAHLLFAAALWGQGRIHVDGSATGVNDGSSWADALTDLHIALALAQPGDEVWVAEGTYLPTKGQNRDSSFVLKSGVRLYGGFSGTETALGQRSPSMHPTVLSGNIGDPADSTDNSYTILYMPHPDTSTLLDGLVFRHAYALSDTVVVTGSRALSGGAVYVMAQDGTGMPSFRDCTFRDNHARHFGGAYYVFAQGATGTTPLFRGCRFVNNSSGSRGGAVHVTGGNGYDRGIEFDHCHFEANSTHHEGGGIYWRNNFGPEEINFLGCTVTRHWQGMYGAFLYMWRNGTNTSRVSIDSCDIYGNGPGEQGYSNELFAVEGYGELRSSVFSFSNSYVRDNIGIWGLAVVSSNLHDNGGTLTDSFFYRNNVFVNNTSSFVASVGGRLAHVRVEGNLFSKNKGHGPYPGGRLWVAGTDVIVANNVFHQNYRTVNVFISALPDATALVEGNLFVDNYKLDDRPGDILTMTAISFATTHKRASGRIVNNVFLNNRSWDAPPIAYQYRSHNTVDNNIFVGNENASGLPKLPFGIGHDTFFLSHNRLDTSYLCGYASLVTCGPGNLFNLDPMFRDTAGGDFSLLPCSPLINAGTNDAVAGIATDLAGNPRILGGTVDIGAYEQVGLALSGVPQAQPSCLGATNGSIAIALEDGGCGPYSYAWSPDAGNGPEIDGLPPGAYIFTITDGSGRQITDTVTVPVAPVPELSLAAQDVTCGTVTGGSLTASVTGGTAPFGYGWSAGLGDLPQHAGLGPGPYALTVSDANGCLDSASATLALIGNLTLSVGAIPISCHGEADAELTVQPANGVPPFNWDWLGWPGNAPTAAPLGPGLYAVTVTDALGCTAAFSFNPVTAPAPLVLGAEGSAQTQSSPPNGAAVVTTTSGGTQPYGYLWDMGETGHAIGGLAAGTYTVTVTDARGCTATAEVVVELMLSATGEPLGVVLFYPNPAVDWVRALLPESRSAGWRLEVSDASGRVVRSSGCADSDCVLDLSGLASGAYVLTARSGERVLVGRVLKQ